MQFSRNLVTIRPGRPEAYRLRVLVCPKCFWAKMYLRKQVVFMEVIMKQESQSVRIAAKLASGTTIR
jgi:hypothetical protein